MEGYLGEIRLFAGNFAPLSWAFCNGQLLSIAEYSALFAILGTTYGGDGESTFALPDLRGRFPLSAGTGSGLTARTQGEAGGVETVTLTQNQVPSHTHLIAASSAAGTTTSPAGAYPAAATLYGSAAETQVGSALLQSVGGSQPHENMPPYLGLNYIICLSGIFPSQN
ncbi:MAG: tail fiber protein [Myxococcota bacterium]